jgi:hypothetical protein
MTRATLRTLIFSLAVLIIGTYTTSYAQAVEVSQVQVDDRNDFVLEPGKSELFLNPGDTVVKEVIVTSRIQGETRFKIQVEDFEGSRDPERPVVILDNQKGPYSSKDFLAPEVQEFTLKFGERIRIPVTVKIPAQAQPGGYYSSVLVSNEPTVIGSSTNANANGTRVISRVGTLFLIRVNGDVKESGNVEDFRLKNKPQLFYEKGPFTFQVLYNNDGNVHLVPYGLITVKNIFGRTVAELPVDAYFALPNSLRYRDITWDGKFMLGRYTATLQLNRGYKDIIDTRSIALWVLPWKFVAGVLLGLIVLVGIILYIKKNFEFKRKD